MKRKGGRSRGGWFLKMFVGGTLLSVGAKRIYSMNLRYFPDFLNLYQSNLVIIGDIKEYE